MLSKTFKIDIVEIIFEGNVKFATEWRPALANKSSEEYRNISVQFLQLVCINFYIFLISLVKMQLILIFFLRNCLISFADGRCV